MNTYPVNNVNFNGKFKMARSKNFINTLGKEGGRSINNLRGKFKKMAEKADVDLFINPEKYFYEVDNNASSYVLVKVRKAPKNFKDKFLNFIDDINPFSMKNRITAFPNEKNFKPKEFLNEVREMIKQVSGKKYI